MSSVSKGLNVCRLASQLFLSMIVTAFAVGSGGSWRLKRVNYWPSFIANLTRSCNLSWEIMYAIWDVVKMKFILSCPLYSNIRQRLLNPILIDNPNFSNISNLDQMICGRQHDVMRYNIQPAWKMKSSNSYSNLSNTASFSNVSECKNTAIRNLWVWKGFRTYASLASDIIY